MGVKTDVELAPSGNRFAEFLTPRSSGTPSPTQVSEQVMRRANLWFLALVARGRQRRFDLDHNIPLLPARVRVDRQPAFKGQLAGALQRNSRCGRGARTNGRSASRNTRKRAMQDRVKAARARTTFASADYDERPPCDNPTTADSPAWS